MAAGRLGRLTARRAETHFKYSDPLKLDAPGYERPHQTEVELEAG
jgi:hypothetical protein